MYVSKNKNYSAIYDYQYRPTLDRLCLSRDFDNLESANLIFKICEFKHSQILVMNETNDN